jgi:hypothetical protein
MGVGCASAFKRYEIDHDNDPSTPPVVEYVTADGITDALETGKEISDIFPAPFGAAIKLLLAAVGGGFATWAKLKSGQRKILQQIVNGIGTRGDDAAKAELARILSSHNLSPEFRTSLINLLQPRPITSPGSETPVA